jgi:hypothetical protein
MFSPQVGGSVLNTPRDPEGVQQGGIIAVTITLSVPVLMTFTYP